MRNGELAVSARQAEHESKFHVDGECYLEIGLRGRVQLKFMLYRANGAFRKLPNNGWRRPLKRGLYSYGEITDKNADKWHAEMNCAAVKEAERIREFTMPQLMDLARARHTVFN